MKIILTAFLLVLTLTTSLGQDITNKTDKTDQVKHLVFKGVPINGTLNDYVAKMKKSGFKLTGTENGFAILEGDFAGYKGCFIGVGTLKQKDLVSKIVVKFPDQDTWSTLSSNYFYLKELLTEKYGEPSEIVEKFDSSYEPRDDNSRMHQVAMDRCKYYTTYEFEEGSIQLSIEHDSVLSYYVTLTYFDKINTKILRDKAKGDL